MALAFKAPEGLLSVQTRLLLELPTLMLDLEVAGSLVLAGALTGYPIILLILPVAQPPEVVAFLALEEVLLVGQQPTRHPQVVWLLQLEAAATMALEEMVTLSLLEQTGAGLVVGAKATVKPRKIFQAHLLRQVL